MASALRELRPDVLLLQECFRSEDGRADTADWLARELGLQCCYVPARRKRRRWGNVSVMSDSGHAVLVRGRVKESWRLDLPTSPEGGERIALLCSGETSEGVRFLAACIHLSHRPGDDLGRAEQLRTVLRHPVWRAPFDLRVMAGDFNAPPDSTALAPLAEFSDLVVNSVFGRLQDGPRTHPCPEPTTSAGRLDEAGFPREARAIDHLLLVHPAATDRESGPRWRVAEARRVLDQPIGGVWPSDHAGLWTVLHEVPPAAV